ncbi:MAG: hypothetical protein EBY18_14970 [Alphaproteobacteria bacterium]|nr:hypothetical protein [Alphaproteobacteria bacterium]
MVSGCGRVPGAARHHFRALPGASCHTVTVCLARHTAAAAPSKAAEEKSSAAIFFQMTKD